ncbi:MAG: hypothetical protein V1744_08260 [Candidatus Altiarchaeota archaeon]
MSRGSEEKPKEEGGIPGKEELDKEISSRFITIPFVITDEDGTRHYLQDTLEQHGRDSYIQNLSDKWDKHKIMEGLFNGIIGAGLEYSNTMRLPPKIDADRIKKMWTNAPEGYKDRWRKVAGEVGLKTDEQIVGGLVYHTLTRQIMGISKEK